MSLELRCSNMTEAMMSDLKEKNKANRFSHAEKTYTALTVMFCILFCLSFFVRVQGVKSNLILMAMRIEVVAGVFSAIYTTCLLRQGNQKREKADAMFHALELQEKLRGLRELNITDHFIFGVNAKDEVEEFAVDTDFVNNYVKDGVLDFSVITKEKIEEVMRF